MNAIYGNNTDRLDKGAVELRFCPKQYTRSFGMVEQQIDPIELMDRAQLLNRKQPGLLELRNARIERDGRMTTGKRFIVYAENDTEATTYSSLGRACRHAWEIAFGAKPETKPISG